MGVRPGSATRRHRWQAAVMAAMVLITTAACSRADEPEPAPSPAFPMSGTKSVEIGGRSLTVHIPQSYASAKPAPLVVLLHGFGSDGAEQESYFKLTPESDRRGFIYAYPDGSTSNRGDRFWNATDACCAFLGPQPDDSAYLSELLTTMQKSYRIDPARVYLIGHSNGGFMSFRMACDHADQVTAIVSLNGATWNDADRCRPSEPVSVLAVHGSADEVIAFGGGANGRNTYPSAESTVRQWRDHNGCSDEGKDGPALDLDSGLAAAETKVRVYQQGCGSGSTVQAWTIEGGRHIPRLGPAFAPAVTDFLLSQSKPPR